MAIFKGWRLLQIDISNAFLVNWSLLSHLWSKIKIFTMKKNSSKRQQIIEELLVSYMSTWLWRVRTFNFPSTSYYSLCWLPNHSIRSQWKDVAVHLSGIQRFGSVLRKISNFNLSSFCDADWRVILMIKRARVFGVSWWVIGGMEFSKIGHCCSFKHGVRV